MNRRIIARSQRKPNVLKWKIFLVLVALIQIVFLLFIYVQSGDKDKEKSPAKNKSIPISTEMKSVCENDSLVKVCTRFERRKQQVRRQCERIDQISEPKTAASENPVKYHLIVDDKYKLLYCVVEKVGCTFWKRVFQILNGFKNVSNPFHTRGMAAHGGFKTAKDMSFFKVNYVLKHYRKFLFVRDPYERLLSAYVDKLFLPYAPYWFELGRFIIEKFRHNATSPTKSCGGDVTFEEFVRYFIYSERNNVKKDAHFFPIYEHCRPCEIEYDYVGKLETFQEDSLYLLEKLGLEKTIRISDFEKEAERDSIINEIDWSFLAKETDKHCVTKSEILFRIYRKLQIRGIISKKVCYPLSHKSGPNVGITEFRQALFDAHAQSGPPEERKLNRKEALVEAYSSLPFNLLMQLQKELNTDLELFGYGINSEILSARKFRYFDIDKESRQGDEI